MVSPSKTAVGGINLKFKLDGGSNLSRDFEAVFVSGMTQKIGGQNTQIIATEAYIAGAQLGFKTKIEAPFFGEDKDFNGSMTYTVSSVLDNAKSCE